jgi:hypothetical protein
MVKQDVSRLREASPLPAGRLQGLWVKNPLPDLGEPEKHWRYVTDDEHLVGRGR